MLDIIEDYLETVNVFKGSDVSLGDLDYVDEATAEFLLYKFKRELKRLPQFLEIEKKSKKKKELRMVDMKKNRDILLAGYRAYMNELASQKEPSKEDLIRIALVGNFIESLYDLDKVDFETGAGES